MQWGEIFACNKQTKCADLTPQQCKLTKYHTHTQVSRSSTKFTQQ